MNGNETIPAANYSLEGYGHADERLKPAFCGPGDALVTPVGLAGVVRQDGVLILQGGVE
jgi:hypothetical protein